MKIKYILLIAISIFISNLLFAQTAIVKGIIIREDTKQPYQEVIVTLPQVKITTTTNANGEFVFSSVPYGNYEMVITPDGIYEEKIQINVASSVVDMAPYEIKPISTSTNNTYSLDNSGANMELASTQDENSISSAGQSVASVLNASRDPYMNAAIFGWGSFFYKMRGYENDQNTLFLNGIPLNDLEDGGVFYNSFSGLNDVFRGRSVSLGLSPNEATFGGLGLNTSIDASASNQRKGTRLTYTLTNRSYRNRLMLTHNSGLMKSGWAYSLSFSKRWAVNGPIKGTFYDAYGYFAAVEKRFKKHGISLNIIGAPVKRGKAGPATKEAFELAGTNYYNPYWGYQNGKVRNTRVYNSHVPMFILSHDAKLNSKTILNSAISYQQGETSTTGIDWYNSADPRPDYYRYMPSYQSSPELTNELAQYIKKNPNYLQVDWDGMYEANRLNKLSGNNRSLYIVNDNVEKTKKLNANINLESNISDHILLYTGIAYQNQTNHDFERVNDLMGGDYWINTNQFAEDGIQGQVVSTSFNVGEKDSLRKVGDIYGYNYKMHFQKIAWFAQSVFTYNKFDFFLAAELGNSSFYREGLYRHGLYQDNSLGNSKKLSFTNYKAKGGFTYKLNGRNYLYANGAIGNKAPFIDNIFVSPRTRNQIVDKPQSEEFKSAELGYLLRTPFVKARLTFYATDIKNATDIKRYYDDQGASFSNNVLQNINKRYTGIEFGTEVKITPTLTASVAGALSQAYYTDRANSTLYSDNDYALGVTEFDSKIVYMKNYYVPAGPQSAFQAGLRYNSKRFWFATISFNYLANNWIDFAPAKRTLDGVDLIKYNSSEWSAAIEQQKLPSAFTIDIFAGKSFKVNRYIKKASNNTYLNLNMGLNNLLNNKNIILYGFENLRLGSSKAQPDWFVPKYAYALGIQYFLNMTLRF